MNNPFDYPGLKILSLFLDDPYRERHLREVAKSADVGAGTAKRFLQFYEENDLITKTRKANLLLFRGNPENHAFRHLKIGHFMLRAKPLIDTLKEAYPDSTITLYGSCARGEDAPDSDIDLLLVGKETQKPDLRRYEQLLNRSITLIAYTPLEWEEKAEKDRAFYERIIIDGIAINGNLPVVSR